jgi:hypothetical protein
MMMMTHSCFEQLFNSSFSENVLIQASRITNTSSKNGENAVDWCNLPVLLSF